MTPPQLSSFTQLDMNSENIRLMFNEPMNETRIDFSGITICSDPTCMDNYALNGGENVRFIDNFRQVIHIDLIPEDIRGIKLLFPMLATSPTNSFVRVTDGTFFDTTGNPNVATATAQPVDPNNYRADTTSPSLLSFQLDVNSGILNLTFNDVIDVRSVQYMFITLQNEQERVSTTEFVTLTNAVPVSDNDYSIQIRIINGDLNNLKAVPSLATNENDTYIVLGSNAFADVAGSFLLPVTESNALQASFVGPDTQRPELMAFTFNASTGVLTLMFNEVVNVSGIVPSGL